MIFTIAFKENTVNQCLYLKVSRSNFVIVVLYVDNIFLDTNDLRFLHDTKQYHFKNFEIYV